MAITRQARATSFSSAATLGRNEAEAAGHDQRDEGHQKRRQQRARALTPSSTAGDAATRAKEP